jgi:hypothetical protein
MSGASVSVKPAVARQWLLVLAATALVSGCPILVVFWLRSTGMVSSALVGVLVGMGLSLLASGVGCVLWEKHPGSEDMLFSDLMIWGYLHRRRTERRLASAMSTVGPLSDAQRRVKDGLDASEQAKRLERLVAAVETRDPYLHGHSRRVARYSWMIAKGMGLTREEVARIRTAAAIHDVGKIETPTAVLHKRGRLNDEEYEVIKAHPDAGARMAITLNDPELTAMVRHHHERMDGTGYPAGLAGEAIPLGARIIAVADTFDAITSSRSYRAAAAHKKAIDVLHEEAGERLDTDVVRAFCGQYAGRRPVAIWATLAGIPERAASWLSAGTAGIASAAKVMAVAAIVGSTAATSSSLAQPAASHTRPAGASALSASTVRASATIGGATPTSHPAKPARRRRSPAAHQRTPANSSAQAGVLSQSTTAGPSSASSPASSGAGASGGNSDPSHSTPSERIAGAAPGAPSAPSEGTSDPKSEEPAQGKSETPSSTPVKEAHGKSEETPSNGETPKVEKAHGKSEEDHGEGEESHGKKEESQGKKEESPGKKEESQGKKEESPGKKEEGHGKKEESAKGKGVVEEVVGKVKEILKLK